MAHLVSAKSASRAAGILVGALVLPYALSPATSQSASGGDYKAAPAQAGAGAGRSDAGEQVFYITTVHLDAKTNVNGDASHPPEPFPGSAGGSSGGFIVRPPDEQGNWSVRAFLFQPSQVVVRQGENVVLNFVGVQGPSHTIAIEGQDERVSLKRGEMKTVRFVAEQPGTIRFVSIGREPTMNGSILVLRRE